jgi:hypothetical protein
MNTIEPRTDCVTIGDKSLAAIEAEWREWKPAQAAADTVPAGWLTARGVAAVRDISSDHAGKSLSEGVKEGTIERRMFRVAVGSIVRPTPHYRIKK